MNGNKDLDVMAEEFTPTGMESVCMCACACVCVCMFMWFMRTQICIITWVWHRYYKEKVIYEDNFSVPIIQKAYKSYRIRFFEKVKVHKVSCKG